MKNNETTTRKEIKPGQWYRHAGCYSNDNDIYILEQLPGAGVQMMDFGAGGLSAPAPQFNAVDEDGRRYQVNANSIDRPGIGGLTLIDRADALTAEDIEALNAKAAQARKKRDDDERAKAEAKAEQRKELPALFPYLETVEKSKKTSWALGAANLRRELKKAFPGQVFSVKSSSFSMGCSIDVSWTDGPTSEEVNAIAKPYEYGTFDAMTDYSGIKENTSWPDVFGGAKYVMAQRSRTLEGTRKAWTKDGNDDSDEITEGGTYGYRYKGQDCEHGNHETRRISDTWSETSLYERPEQPAKSSGTAAGAVTITEHTHTKKGFQMWIVQLSERLERDQFNALRATAKDGGGWYSHKWGSAPAGFAFDNEEAAQVFAQKIA